MSDYVLPVLFSLLIWWLTTGVLLYLHRLPPRTYPWSMSGMTLLAGLALFIHDLASAQVGLVSAYVAFSCGILLWGWLELAYFTGYLVGPCRRACPRPCRGWQRFWLAILTSLYHELGILITAAVLVVATWNDPNQFGVWSFVVLWLMRWSAKLNLFLGVPNLNEHWLPERMRFLSSYMRKRPMNLLFPLSITASTILLGLLVEHASEPFCGDFMRVGLMLVSTLLALGILEHWFLVLPFSEEIIWRWAIREPSDELPSPGSGYAESANACPEVAPFLAGPGRKAGVPSASAINKLVP